MIVWIIAIVVLVFFGKLIYDREQRKSKKEQNLNLDEFEAKDRFQRLAGIGQPKNEHEPEIWKYIANKVSEEKFPEPDPSNPITMAKLTTIDTKFEDSDELATIPLNRVSKKAKQKMAEIAKEDIRQQIEKQSSIFPDSVEYTDEYYKKVPVENNPLVKAMMDAPENDQRLGMEFVKPKRKYTKKPKK